MNKSNSQALFLFISASLMASACGRVVTIDYRDLKAPTAPVGEVDESGVVVMARASIPISTEQQLAVVRGIKNLGESLFVRTAYANNPTAVPVSVVVAADAQMTVSTSAFAIPTVSNSVLNFGKLVVTALQSNDLRKCGTNGKQRCDQALFRMYTSGVAGAGMYNTADGYGVPISSSGVLSGTVGLDPAGAVVLQTLAVTKNVVRLSDFSPTPEFGVTADFTDAGAGSYGTVLNVEFALSP